MSMVKPKRHKKVWSKKEIEYLKEYWGYKTLKQLSKKLDRTESSILRRVRILKLGSPRDLEYLTKAEVGKILGKDYKTLTKIGVPFKAKAFINKPYYVITIDNLLKWLKNNPDKYNAKFIKEYSLGIEPEWLKKKRKKDVMDKSMKKWSEKDDINLKNMLFMGISFEQIGLELNRSGDSCRRRAYRIGLIKPSKEKGEPWSKEEDLKLEYCLFNTNMTLSDMSEEIGRTVPAIKTRIIRKHKTSYTEVRSSKKYKGEPHKELMMIYDNFID